MGRRSSRKQQTEDSDKWQPASIARNNLIPLAEAFETFARGASGWLSVWFLQQALKEYDFKKVCWSYEFYNASHAPALVNRVKDTIDQCLALPFPDLPVDRLEYLWRERKEVKDEELKLLCRQEAELLVDKFMLEWECLKSEKQFQGAIEGAAEAAEFLRHLALLLVSNSGGRAKPTVGRRRSGRPRDEEVVERIRILRTAGIENQSDLRDARKLRNAFGALDSGRKKIPGSDTTDWMDLLDNPERSEELKRVKESLRLNLIRNPTRKKS